MSSLLLNLSIIISTWDIILFSILHVHLVFYELKFSAKILHLFVYIMILLFHLKNHINQVKILVFYFQYPVYLCFYFCWIFFFDWLFVILLQENGAQEDGHVFSLRWVPGMGHQVRVLGFTQERIQERAIVKWKQLYLERYTFHRQNAVCPRRERGSEIWGS